MANKVSEVTGRDLWDMLAGVNRSGRLEGSTFSRDYMISSTAVPFAKGNDLASRVMSASYETWRLSPT
jgi:hypothetical protein